MPKTATKSGTSRTHESSRKKRSSTNAQTQIAESSTAPSDPSRWRASKLRDSDTITKGNAVKQYHLKQSDFEGIPFRTEQTVAKGRFITSMYIYKERDIERRAWEKHGGPEGYNKYLTKLRAMRIKKHGPHSYFPQPSTYDDPRGGVYGASIQPGIPSGSNVGDPYVGRSPTLLKIKNQMAPWLWTAYNKALSDLDEPNWMSIGLSGRGLFTEDRDREWPMKRALVPASTYPPRPAHPLASSGSVDRVRAVLEEATSLPEGTQEEDVEDYEWSEDYLERLFSALIEVVNQHGLGAEGLEGIRWEVYDKRVACMHDGIYYDRGDDVWSDGAAEWLDGQFTDVGILLEMRCRGKCPAGRRFNHMLPQRHPRGYASVGVCPG
ncbi:hypothetical protein GSI_02816 [Ganoderma sinense ZZ0214-1]|uniref:Uncharacterized protein n=1 Tax=Ganoderma sinense ZZ0214-1 TaxID=1077348 RepID=A0A2G8SMQ7_9APHY|nr:hypothetical protein GSI_02816 [Ganoderma sinense ZZ0214-1]